MAYRHGRGRYPPRKPKLFTPADWGYGASSLERDIQRGIVTALEKLSFDVSVFSESRRTNVEPGHPDLYARHAAWGLRLYVEVKTETGRLSRVQRAWHERERAAGGTVLVVRSVEECMTQVAALRRRSA